jgi:AraC-like DNA-binding protein
MESLTFEKHYRVKELASLWGLSPKTVSRIFAEETGVIRIVNHGKAKRKYSTLSIPASIALRVHEKLGNQPLQLGVSPSQPTRVIRLRDMNSPAKPNTVIRIKA